MQREWQLKHEMALPFLNPKQVGTAPVVVVVVVVVVHQCDACNVLCITVIMPSLHVHYSILNIQYSAVSETYSYRPAVFY